MTLEHEIFDSANQIIIALTSIFIAIFVKQALNTYKKSEHKIYFILEKK